MADMDENAELEIEGEALQTGGEHFRRLVQALPIPVAYSDRHGEILTTNERFTQVLGYAGDDIPDVETWFRLAYPDPVYRAAVVAEWTAALSRAVQHRGEVDPIEARVTCKDGRQRTMLISAVLLGEDTLVAFQDVTAIRRAEAEHRALQGKRALASRLAALRTLVAGVAHEINNPLAALMSNTATALEEVEAFRAALVGDAPLDRVGLLPRTDEVREALGDAKSSADRIAAIVKDLAVFGSPDQARSRVRLADTIQRSLQLLPPFVAERARLEVEIAEVPQVMASEGQLEQVIVNLVANAALAIQDGRKGEVRIRLGSGKPGAVRVEISDDGQGIRPDLVERIFEPFFTTRKTGKGTGLGLAICNSIVSAHDGTLTVASEAGVGSTFRIELPVPGHDRDSRPTPRRRSSDA